MRSMRFLNLFVIGGFCMTKINKINDDGSLEFQYERLVPEEV